MNFIQIGDALVNLDRVTVLDYDPFLTPQNQPLPHGKLRVSGGGSSVEINVDVRTFQAIAQFLRGDRQAFAGGDNPQT
jgi:hypothetical protein